ncbi:hypothetical protein HK104_009579, partial [Borealophlyctis nickersoniae]
MPDTLVPLIVPRRRTSVPAAAPRGSGYPPASGYPHYLSNPQATTIPSSSRSSEYSFSEDDYDSEYRSFESSDEAVVDPPRAAPAPNNLTTTSNTDVRERMHSFTHTPSDSNETICGSGSEPQTPSGYSPNPFADDASPAALPPPSSPDPSHRRPSRVTDFGNIQTVYDTVVDLDPEDKVMGKVAKHCSNLKVRQRKTVRK